MLTKPVDQVTASDAAGCEIEHEALLVVYAGIDFAAVENEEDLHGGVSDAFVAIDKGVALNQREGERSGLLNQRGIQIAATERGLGLADRGSSTPKSRIPDAPPVAWRRRRCRSTTSPRVR